MIEVSINYWAVVVAAVSSMVIGFLWYGPLFGKPWMTLMGFTPESAGKMKMKAGQSYIVMFVAALLTMYVLAHFLALTGVTTVTGGLQGAFWAWLGFVATVQIGVVLWENKSPKLFLLNTLYSLVSFLIAGAILGAWI